MDGTPAHAAPRENRHDVYQTSATVVLTVYRKNTTSAQVAVETVTAQDVRVWFAGATAQDDVAVFEMHTAVPLDGAVAPKVSVHNAKVEVQWAKAVGAAATVGPATPVIGTAYPRARHQTPPHTHTHSWDSTRPRGTRSPQPPGRRSLT